MKLIAMLRNKLIALNYKRNDLKIIEGIAEHTFENILTSYRENGWEQTDAYRSFDATYEKWHCNLRKGSSVLCCRWTKSDAGSISGLTRIIQPLAAKISLTARDSPNR